MKNRFRNTLCLIALLPALALPGWSQTPPGGPATSPQAGGDLPIPPPAVSRRATALIDRIRQLPPGPERDEVIADLVDIGPPVLALIQAEAERRSPNTMPVMIYALGAIGDKRVIPFLRFHAFHQKGLIYMEALYALALAGDSRALADALRSSYATISFTPEATAMDFIAGSQGPAVTPFLVREIPLRGDESRMAGLGALGTLCDGSAVPFLVEWAKNPNPNDRRFALMALARIGGPEAQKCVLAGLSDPAFPVVEAAAEGAGYLRITAAIPTLGQLLDKTESLALRPRAVWSLGLIGGNEAGKFLLRALTKPRDDVDHALILEALGNAQDSLVIPTLAQESKGTNPVFAQAAIRSLVKIKSRESSDRLLDICTEAPNHSAGLLAARELITRRDPRANPCALRRLAEEIEQRNGLDPVAEEILTDLPLSATIASASTLDSMANKILAPVLQHRLRDAADQIRMVSDLGNNPAQWLEKLDNGTPTEVELAIVRLGDLADPSAVEPLVRRFGQIEPDRAWRIPEALGRIGSERATPFLISLLTGDVYRVPSLIRARKEAVRALARYSKSPQAAEAMKTAFLAERGRLFEPLMAYARMRGAEAIPDLLELKKQLLRRRSSFQTVRHEKVNWAIRLLRDKKEIPLDAIKDGYDM